MKFSVSFVFCLLFSVFSYNAIPASSDDEKGNDQMSEEVKKIFDEAIALVKDHAKKYSESTRKNMHDSISTMTDNAGKQVESSWQKTEQLVDSMQNQMESVIKSTNDAFNKMLQDAKDDYESRRPDTRKFLGDTLFKLVNTQSFPERAKSLLGLSEVGQRG